MRPKSGFLWYLFVGFVVVCGISWTTPSLMVSAADNKAMTAVNVGVVLDLSSRVGKTSLSCIDMSVSDFYVSHPQHNTTIVLHIKDSRGDVVAAIAQGMEVIEKNKVEVILGMESWLEAYFIMKQLGEKAEIPIVSFAPKSSTFSYLKSPYLFRVAQNQSSQVYAIYAIVTNFAWKYVVAMYQDDEFGNWIIADLIHALQVVYIRVHRSVIDSDASGDQIVVELQRLKMLRTTVVVVHMEPSLATQVFYKAEEIGMMSEGYAWILSSATANVLSSLNYSTLSSMQGVLGVKAYVPRTVELQNFTSRWRRKFRQDNPTVDDPQLDVYGLWAYDAAWALAMAVERIEMDPNFTSEVSSNGEKIRESLSKTKFKGVSGEFNLVKGQLESPNLEIVNVIEDGQIMRVGYWTPEMKLTRDLKRKGDLRPIIWPGHSFRVPKGLGTPETKKLKIGVPLNAGFSEFTLVKNGSIVGYCIDIFEAVVQQLRYDVPREYVPFSYTHGRSSDSYDDLIVEVSRGVYDVAVGDITILASRSLWVDFTLPFTEAGIAVVVPLRRNLRNHAWVFLKPLTLDLWITTLCFFVFMGFVVWILEHRNNERLRRGPPSHQIGTTLWFSFCTIVFAQWETLVSNLARLVVVIWFFVVFILTQSYTASLTSWLTVQQLQPVTDINQIIKNNWGVGYQQGSYVLHTLQSLGIKNLVPYASLEELHQLFAKGSCNGGIDAVIDEVPYMKLFLSTHYDDYTMADSLFKSNGFGFAFQLGSSIVEDMSKALLKVTESEKMGQIQDKWFGKKTGNRSCSSFDFSSSSLDLSYFQSLFLIAASTAVFALLLYFFRNRTRSHSSVITAILQIFRFKDARREGPNPPAAMAVEVSPTTISPPSPSHDSVDSAESLNESGDPSHGNHASSEIIGS